MSTFKKAKVVMLLTNEKATVNSIVTRPSDNRMEIVNVLTGNDPQLCIHYHLYIISDDDIKEGDWCYDSDIKNMFKAVKGNLNFDQYIKKIIATTDSSLEIKNELWSAYKGRYEADKLPQPSQSFIEKYIESYNKGNIVTDVLVEYIDIVQSRYGDIHELTENDSQGYINTCNLISSNVKVNSRDNTITIKKIKDSWSRDELKLFKNVDGNNHLKFIYERLVNVHGENSNYDYMHKLKNICDFIDDIIT